MSQERPVSQSLKEYGRGLAGGLLFSLPLLYTMEVWWSGFLSQPGRLIVYVLVMLVLLLGYNQFVGIHEDIDFRDVIFDSLEEAGLGLLTAAFLLWLLGRITSDMGSEEIMGKIIIEGMMVAIGVSVGSSQLGMSGDDEEDSDDGSDAGQRSGPEAARKSGKSDEEPHLHPLRSVVMAACGAVLVASNVAPTEEVVVIGVEASVWKLIGIVLLSLLAGALILYYSEFRGSGHLLQAARGPFDIAAGIVMMYGVALASSAFMLWFFGRFNGADYLTMVSETVVLAFPAALGASAGRLLIAQ